MGDLIGAETCLLGVVSSPLAPREEGRPLAEREGYKMRERLLQARHNLALIFMATGRFAEAEGQWREILADYPDYAPARAGLAELERHAQVTRV